MSSLQLDSFNILLQFYDYVLRTIHHLITTFILNYSYLANKVHLIEGDIELFRHPGIFYVVYDDLSCFMVIQMVYGCILDILCIRRSGNLLGSCWDLLYWCFHVCFSHWWLLIECLVFITSFLYHPSSV